MEDIKEKTECARDKACDCSEQEPCKENCHCNEEVNKQHECHCKEEKNKDKKKEKKNKEIESLQVQLEKITNENKELLSKLQYCQADLINYRKRKEEEIANMLKFANQDIICEIIPVLDNFERAIKLDDNNLTDELSKFLQGFKMMYATLLDILKKYGVEEIECQNKEFDPTTMEALMIDKDQNFKNDEVLEVLLKGYILKGRVIRPASVRVNKIEEGEE